VRNIVEYFDIIESVVAHSGSEDAEVSFEQTSQTSGMVEGFVNFYDGSRLEFTEVVYLEGQHPIKKWYRYQYIREGNAVFRYDNAPHYPDLPDFPHHKHTAEGEVVSATEPTLGRILREIVDLFTAD